MQILKAKISPLPKTMFDPMPEVVVTWEDGSVESLFEFYPDEIQFHPEEFVGLTREEAFQLRHRRDVAWLQS